MVAWTAPVLFAAYRGTIRGMIWSVLLLIVATLLGLIITGIVGGALLLEPLYRWRALKNGAPFKVGDTVMILAGPRCGRVARVYDVWPERGQVRVELSESERLTVKDVFSDFAVCRHPGP